MNIGKLYQINKYFWLLFPSKENAATSVANDAYAYAAAAATATAYAAWWSKEFNFNVTYIPENSIFCLLEQEGKFRKVLSANGELGWIIYSENVEWAKDTIEEVKQ